MTSRRAPALAPERRHSTAMRVRRHYLTSPVLTSERTVVAAIRTSFVADALHRRVEVCGGVGGGKRSAFGAIGQDGELAASRLVVPGAARLRLGRPWARIGGGRRR